MTSFRRFFHLRAIALLAAMFSIFVASAYCEPANAAATNPRKVLKIAIADEEFRPFHWKKSDGSFEGFDPDIANAICAAMKSQCVMVAVPWGDLIPSLLEKKYDFVVSSMMISKERKRIVDFSKPYQRPPAKLLVRKDAQILVTAKGLSGKTLGVERFCPTEKSNAAIFLKKKFGKGPQIKFYDMVSPCPKRGYATLEEIVPTLDRRIADLVAGKIDAIFDDKLSLSYVLDKLSGKQLEFAGPDFFDYLEGNGIALRKRQTKLLNAINAAIDSIRDDGTYDKIQTKYFPFDMFGQ